MKTKYYHKFPSLLSKDSSSKKIFESLLQPSTNKENEIIGLKIEESSDDESLDGNAKESSNDLAFWQNLLGEFNKTSNNSNSAPTIGASNGSLPVFGSVDNGSNGVERRVKTIDLTNPAMPMISHGHPNSHHNHNNHVQSGRSSQHGNAVSRSLNPETLAQFQNGAGAHRLFHGLPSTSRSPNNSGLQDQDLLTTNSHGNHVCRICNLRFTRQKMYAKHMVKVHNEKPYKCPICGKPSGRSDYILTHMRRKHPEQLAQHSKMKSCKHCGQLVHDRGMQQHLLTYHSELEGGAKWGDKSNGNTQGSNNNNSNNDDTTFSENDTKGSDRQQNGTLLSDQILLKDTNDLPTLTNLLMQHGDFPLGGSEKRSSPSPEHTNSDTENGPKEKISKLDDDFTNEMRDIISGLTPFPDQVPDNENGDVEDHKCVAKDKNNDSDNDNNAVTAKLESNLIG